MQLHREWRRLRRDPHNLIRAAGWQIATGHVGDLDEVLVQVGFEVRHTATHERALRQLVEIASHDDLAARLVVQRLLPGSLSVVRRQRQNGRGHDALAEMLGALWIAIRTFNPARSPSCVAAALIGDAEYHAFKRAGRQRSSSERPSEFPLDIAEPEHDLHPWEELAQLVCDATESKLTLASELAYLRCLLETPHTTDIARALNVSPRTVRNRRDQAAQRLRQLVAA
ncbi:MAG TPA: hypothetical protein VMM60_03790 [Ilumatobacter sp.]|nr:hypothetical protein [Ilumatobacter sp.]